MTELTEAEELFLGNPLALEPDETPCDRYGCDRSAFVLVPGAALCFACAVEFGVGRDIYDIPLDELVGDERWREARRADYIERIRVLRATPRRREQRDDDALDRLAAAAVSRLIQSRG